MIDFCDWPVSYDACGATLGDPDATPPVPASTGCRALDELTPEQRASFERMAAEMLWGWTRRVFGICKVTVRPCLSDCQSARLWSSTFWGNGPYPWAGIGGSGRWSPQLIGGEWYNLDCGCPSTCTCSTSGAAALHLPGPVGAVTEVLIDGEVVDPAAYVVMYGRTLVRTDGGTWPPCQDLLAPPTAAGTFQITYERGVAVPIGGQIAAGILACELAKAACGDSTCQLPQRIQTVTRQGVTVGFVDNFSGLEDARTGIWLIDSWVSSHRQPRGFAGVRSPDVKPKQGGAPWNRV